MKRFISVSAIFLLLCSSYIFSGCSQKAPSESLLAEFDNQGVTLVEFDKEVSELSGRDKRKYEGKEGLAEYLALMAESRMLLEVAKEQGLDKDGEMVRQIEDYKNQLLVKELVKREVDDKVVVTDADLNKYYEEHLADYVEPEKVVVTEITLKDEDKAKEVMEKIKGGADFTELAKEMDATGETFGPGKGSEGKTKPFSMDQFRTAQEFATAAFNLEVNQMSDIIVQPLGEETYYMIVRLEERTPSRQQEFSEVEKKVDRIVQKEKKKERMDMWLKTVKVEKRFQIYPERIPEPVEEIEETATEAIEGATEEAATEATEEATEEKTEEADAKTEEVKEEAEAKDQQETSE